MLVDKNTTINTRQKFGSLAKKALKLFYDNKSKIFQFTHMVHETQKILKEFKKSIDIICLYESIGLLTRVGAEKYIYTGFRGISGRFLEFQMNRKRNKPNVIVYDEINYDGKIISIRPHLQLGVFFHEIFFGLIYSNGKFTTKNQIQVLVEQFSAQNKEINTKNFVPDIINLLSMLNFIEKNQSTEVLTYIGPDFTTFDEKNYKKNPEKILNLIKRQEIFYCKQQFQIDAEAAAAIISQAQKVNNQTSMNEPKIAHISYIPELSFALLKSKTWQHPIKTTTFIIGRGGASKTWKVDLDLPFKSVSRQHAVILFNFEAQKWEIRCLSKKNLIKVDGQRYAYRDKQIFLRDKSVIEIGLETFMFCMLEKQ